MAPRGLRLFEGPSPLSGIDDRVARPGPSPRGWRRPALFRALSADGFGETSTRDLWAAFAGASVVLEALAFDGRGEGEGEDACDFYQVVAKLRALTRPLRIAGASPIALEP